MTKEIRLSDGQVAMVDDEDFERVSRIKWSPHSAGYAVGYDADLYVPGQPSKALVLLHRYVMGCTAGDGVRVDHRNHNKLDCRRTNLRAGTQAANMMNRAETIRGGFSSQFRGVAHRAGRSKQGNFAKPWLAYYQREHIGVFATEEEAAYCRDLVALNRDGVHAQLNYPITGLEVINV